MLSNPKYSSTGSSRSTELDVYVDAVADPTPIPAQPSPPPSLSPSLPDGIGKAMAFEMAKKGMNLLLISRTESKLVAAEEELKATCPKISVEHLAIDYSDFDATRQVSERANERVVVLG